MVFEMLVTRAKQEGEEAPISLLNLLHGSFLNALAYTPASITQQEFSAGSGSQFA